MGYLLKEALKNLCGVNQWSYAVFWKFASQNPKLLIWEESYYEPLALSIPQTLTNDFCEASLDYAKRGATAAENCSLQPRTQSLDDIPSLVNRMMVENQICIVGEGIIGRSAFTGVHQWILANNFCKSVNPPEVSNEVQHQFLSGIQTIAVIPVTPHGVVQFGSSYAILENLGFVNDVKSLILQLGCISGALFSVSTMGQVGEQEYGGGGFTDPEENCGLTSSGTLTAGATELPWYLAHAPGNITQMPCSSINNFEDNAQITASMFQTPKQDIAFAESQNNESQSKVDHFMGMCLPGRHQREAGIARAEVIPPNNFAWLNQQGSSQKLNPEMDYQPKLSNSRASHSTFYPIEKQVFSDVITQNPADDKANALHRTNTSQMRINGDYYLHSQKALDAAQPLEGSDFTYGVSSDLTSVSALSSHSEGLMMKNEFMQPLNASSNIPNEHISLHKPRPVHAFEKHEIGSHVIYANIKHEDVSSQELIGDDFFDGLGGDSKSKIMNQFENLLVDVSCGDGNTSTHKVDSANAASVTTVEAEKDLCMSDAGLSDADMFSMIGSDHLLDAVVSGACFASKEGPKDMSGKAALTKVETAQSDSPLNQRICASSQMQLGSFGFSKPIKNAGRQDSGSSKSGHSRVDIGSCSRSSSFSGSHITSWVDQVHNAKCENSVSTAYSKRNDEINKPNRKRLKPGENPRPRPKDRQMIQDRLKELREIVPSGAKCSIDALLERTIKHMLFLQSVAKHADKIKQIGEPKIINEDGILHMKNKFEGGATWALEIGSQSLVCPIIVEDLNAPRQMLVEVLCEERGFFLELADVIRGLGMTILKGVMEARIDKIWARFVVEANRDMTRMEVFMSLARHLEHTMKDSSIPNNSVDDPLMIHPPFTQAISVPGGLL